MEINNEMIKLIQSKVPLYLNKTYFKIFKDILIDCTKKSLRNKNPNIKKLNNNNKINIFSINKNENLSLWFNIMRNIYITKEMKYYNLKKSILIDDESNLISKEKNEEDYCYVFFQNKKKKYETNNLVYLYLSHLSKIKLRKFEIISKKENISLTNIIRIYLGLCAQNIVSLKINLIDKNDENEINHKNFRIKKDLIKKITLKDEIIKNENINKNGINNETKFNNISFKIKYISELKTNLAKKFINSKKRENNKNIKKNKKDNENDTDNENNNNNDKNDKEKKNKGKLTEDLLNEEFINGLNFVKKKVKTYI